MKQPIDRRYFLRHSLTTMIALVVAACAPKAQATPAAMATASPQPTSTPQPTATPVPVVYLPQPPLVNETEALHPPVYTAMIDGLAEIPEEERFTAEYAQWHRLYLLEEDAQSFTADTEAEARALYEAAMQAFKAEQDHVLVIQQAADGSLITLLYLARENGVYGHFTPQGAMLPWGIWQPDSQARLVLLAEGSQPGLTYNPADGHWYLFQLADDIPQGVYIPHTDQWIPTNEAGEALMAWNEETGEFAYLVPPIPESQQAMLAFVEHHGGVLHKPDKSNPEDTYYYYVTKTVEVPINENETEIREIELRLIEYDPTEGWQPSYETWDRLFSERKLGTLSALMDVEVITDAPFFIREGEKGKQDRQRVWNMQYAAYEQLVGLNENQIKFNSLPWLTFERTQNHGISSVIRENKALTPIVYDGIDITRPHGIFLAQQPEGSATQALVLVPNAFGGHWFSFNQAKVNTHGIENDEYTKSFTNFAETMRNPDQFPIIVYGYALKLYGNDLSPAEQASKKTYNRDDGWVPMATRIPFIDDEVTDLSLFRHYAYFAEIAHRY
ncbi:MAG: hypothetical protein HPY85_14190 [Anaerolineae bacterium]|nr:hypothetical protein [Anaerolineae bacterium]